MTLLELIDTMDAQDIGMYLDENGRPFIIGYNVTPAIRDAAKRHRQALMDIWHAQQTIRYISGQSNFVEGGE